MRRSWNIARRVDVHVVSACVDRGQSVPTDVLVLINFETNVALPSLSYEGICFETANTNIFSATSIHRIEYHIYISQPPATKCRT